MEALSISHILCPTDFDDLSGLALDYAGRLAGRTGARLTVLYADSFLPPREFTSHDAAAVARSLEAERKAALKHLQRYAQARVPSGVPFDAVVAVAEPAPGILAEATKHSADLIVMATHGRSGVDRLVLGSVTEHVLSEAKVPVLAVRPSQAGASPGEIRRILLPTNFTPADETALRQAAGLAAALSAELVVAHIAPDAGVAPATEERICAWADGPAPRCSLRKLVRHGDPVEQILKLASDEKVDLLVVAGQRRRLLDLVVFGSTTERLIRHAPAPVWVVPRD